MIDMYIAHFFILQGVEREEVISIQQLEPGAHICYWRGHFLFMHHAICVGVNYEAKTYDIIHFTGGATQFTNYKSSGIGTGARIVEESGQLFKKEELMYRCIHTNALASMDVVHRARQMLNEEPQNYHAFRNNCEHFAFYCKTGTYKSLTAEAWRRHCCCLLCRCCITTTHIDDTSRNTTHIDETSINTTYINETTPLLNSV